MYRVDSVVAAPPRRYRLVVPGILDERPRAVRFVAAICRNERLASDVEHALVSAFGEAFNHAVLYGYRDAAGMVTVEVERSRGKIAVMVRDRGAGFAQHTGDAEAERARRYGLFIMLRAMDEVRWYEEGGENVVVLVKRLTPRRT